MFHRIRINFHKKFDTISSFSPGRSEVREKLLKARELIFVMISSVVAMSN